MTDVTVKQLAEDIGAPLERLLQQRQRLIVPSLGRGLEPLLLRAEAWALDDKRLASHRHR